MRQAVDDPLSQLNTAMPGIVTEVNETKRTVNVQTQFKRRYRDETEPVDMGIIPNVPIMDFGAGEASIHIPVAVGDSVQLLFNQRSIDKWLEQGKPSDPGFIHRFELKDAVAIPGLRHKNNQTATKGDPDSLTIQNGDAFIEMTKDGKFKITGVGGVDVLSELASLAGTLSSATAITHVGPAPMDGATIAAATLVQTKINGISA